MICSTSQQIVSEMVTDLMKKMLWKIGNSNYTLDIRLENKIYNFGPTPLNLMCFERNWYKNKILIVKLKMDILY